LTLPKEKKWNDRRNNFMFNPTNRLSGIPPKNTPDGKK